MNTFGPLSTEQYPIYHSREVIDARARFRREPIPELEHANSMRMTCGREASCGYVLMERRHYDRLNRYGTTFQLHINDPRQQDNVGVLYNLSIVHARCVSRGIAADPDALYLVELTDGRGVLHNKWSQFPLTASYNIRAPGYPQTFHPNSMNSGTTWTWATMLQNIWETMSLHLGSWPGLPQGVVPAGTPEGFWFQGVPAWSALCDVLDHLGLVVACNLTSQSQPFTIVDDGATDTAFTALQTKYTTHLEDDEEWIDIGAARVPGTVKVLFRRRNSVYGTEETVRYDSLQWNMTPLYSISVSAPATFTGATGTHHIWSDFTIRYDQDNSPVAEDVTTATTIAQERVTQYFDRIYSRTYGHMSQTYAGALPFKTGSQVDVVEWNIFNDDSRRGWKTRICRGGK